MDAARQHEVSLSSCYRHRFKSLAVCYDLFVRPGESPKFCLVSELLLSSVGWFDVGKCKTATWWGSICRLNSVRRPAIKCGKRSKTDDLVDLLICFNSGG